MHHFLHSQIQGRLWAAREGEYNKLKVAFWEASDGEYNKPTVAFG